MTMISLAALLSIPICVACVSEAPEIPGFAPNGDSALLPGASHSGWWRTASGAEEKIEYEYREGARGDWSAPNLSQGLRTTVTSRGIRVFSRNGDFLAGGPTWRMELAWTGFGHVGRVGSILDAAVSAQGNTAILDHGFLKEQLINDSRGIEHLFEIAAAPREGSGDLWIGLTITGDLEPRIDRDAQSILFHDSRGTPRLYYRDLLVFDANGDVLKAQFQDGITGFGIRIDGQGAVYPITVDPLLTGPVWASYQAASARFGSFVGSAGDLNNDGFPDIFVSAPELDDGAPNSGKVFVYFGSNAGPSLQPDWSVSIGLLDAYTGRPAGIGDVNGDGSDDFLVVAKEVAYVWYGGSMLPAGGGTPANANWSVSFPGDDFGRAVSGGKDLTGDGQSDFVITSPSYDNERGRVHVFAGTSAGPVALPPLEGINQGDHFGDLIDATGDFTGDGIADLLVALGETSNGTQARFSIHPGGTGGPSVASWTRFFSTSLNFLVGASSAGDVNGDGMDDLAVGWRYPGGGSLGGYRTQVYLTEGGEPKSLPAFEYVMAEGLTNYLAYMIEALGDVNQDGFGDFAVSYRLVDSPFEFGGRVDLFLGSNEPQGDPARVLYGPWEHAGLGILGRVGDVNLDGFDDLLIGAPGGPFGFPNSSSSSAAFLFFGGQDPAGLQADWDFEADKAGSLLGTGVVLAQSLNGDAYGDLVASAPFYSDDPASLGRIYAFDGHPFGLPAAPSSILDEYQLSTLGFGRALAIAGDVNGSGNAELLVDGYSSTAGKKRRVELRSAKLDSPTPDLAVFLGPNGEPTFGEVLSGLGDLNLDGLEDFALAHPDSSEHLVEGGLVRIYYGNTNFLQLQSAAATLIPQQPGEQFGASVASADINGDGLLDLLVGAPGWTSSSNLQEGRVHVFMNATSGFSSQADFILDHGSAGSTIGFGRRVLGRLNLNGDGFDDFAVARTGLVGDFDHVNGGGVQFFLGGTGDPVAGLYSFGVSGPGWLTGDSLANAGDLDGDGIDDLLIGIPGFSGSYSHEGSVIALSGKGLGQGNPSTVLLNLVGGAPEMRFGAAIAGGVDIDANGWPDVAVGAPGFSNGEPSEGAVFLFLTAPSPP